MDLLNIKNLIQCGIITLTNNTLSKVTLSDIRLRDIKQRGGCLIRDPHRIAKNTYTGTLYYYYDKYDTELSFAEVTVRYFPIGGATIIGPSPNSNDGFDKLLKYIDKLSEDSVLKSMIMVRKTIDALFIIWQTVLLYSIFRHSINAIFLGDIYLWENVIIKTIMLIALHQVSLIFKRY
ncbi:hypothetical protein [Butyrivibrio sp. WCE2006]|uniref:hypothetical protein n=1 Tax=Butyrivibrio sp. WCE2006 TaxID=1410611 RepID=UPI0005D19ED7|nr:hypothetical protein [Butyrivibrio sp. WCE2006]